MQYRVDVVGIVDIVDTRVQTGLLSGVVRVIRVTGVVASSP